MISGDGPTVLVVTTGIPAHTLNATLPVRGLVARGARVLWCPAPPYAQHAARQGATVLEPVPRSQVRLPAGGACRGLGQVRALYRDGLTGAVGEQADHLLRLARDHRVDVLLSDSLMFAAGLAAEAGTLGWASFGDGPLAWPDPQVPPFGTGLAPMAGPFGRHRNRTVRRVAHRALFAPALRQLNQARAERGLWPLPELLTAGLSPQLHLQGCAPGFEYPRTWHPGGLHHVGALGPGPGHGDALPPGLRRGTDPRPLALVTQGTLRADPAELVDAACRGLTRCGFRVLVAGRAGPSHQHPDVTWVESLDLPDALPHCDLLVTNGGYTTVTLALAAGVGVVQCGATEEKPDIGARLEYAGVGRSIRLTRPPAGLLGRAARQVWASPARRRASRELARQFSELDAAALSAQAVLDLAGRRGSRR